jgi:hypothetical protein
LRRRVKKIECGQKSEILRVYDKVDRSKTIGPSKMKKLFPNKENRFSRAVIGLEGLNLTY